MEDTSNGVNLCSSALKPTHAFEMPGKRYDIGDARSYAQVQEEYKGIN